MRIRHEINLKLNPDANKDEEGEEGEEACERSGAAGACRAGDSDSGKRRSVEDEMMFELEPEPQAKKSNCETTPAKRVDKQQLQFSHIELEHGYSRPPVHASREPPPPPPQLERRPLEPDPSPDLIAAADSNGVGELISQQQSQANNNNNKINSRHILNIELLNEQLMVELSRRCRAKNEASASTSADEDEDGESEHKDEKADCFYDYETNDGFTSTETESDLEAEQLNENHLSQHPTDHNYQAHHPHHHQSQNYNQNHNLQDRSQLMPFNCQPNFNSMKVSFEYLN